MTSVGAGQLGDEVARGDGVEVWALISVDGKETEH